MTRVRTARVEHPAIFGEHCAPSQRGHRAGSIVAALSIVGYTASRVGTTPAVRAACAAKLRTGHPLTFWEHANVSWVDDFLTVPSYLAALYLLVRMVTPRTHQLPPTTRRFALGASHQLSDLRILGHGTMAVVLAMECLFPFFGKASVFDPMDCVMYVASNVLTYVLLGCAWWPNAGGRRK